MSWQKILSILLIVILGGGAAVYYYRPDLLPLATSTAPDTAPAAAAAGAGAPPPMPVEAQTVTTETIERTLEAVGTLASNESVIIRPEIGGRIADILLKEGEPVAENAVLVRLDDSIYRAELAEAQASLALSSSNYKRAQDLYSKRIGSERDRDEAKAALDADQARVNLAQVRLEKMALRAPFDGVLGLRKISVGDYVTPGQDIVNLEDIETLKVDFRIAETYLPLIHEGQTLRINVDALPGQTFEGAVYAIDPRIDADGRSIVIRARVTNNQGVLRPGLFARVGLVVERRADALLISEQALMPQGEQQFVYKVVDGNAVMTPVTTGLRRAGQVEITEGLSVGDTVVIAGQMKVRPGAPVAVLPPPGEQNGAPVAKAETGS